MWIERKIEIKSFQHEDEPEMIHVIKTGFNDLYMIVWEDVFEIDLGKVEFGTKKEVEIKFKISL